MPFLNYKSAFSRVKNFKNLCFNEGLRSIICASKLDYYCNCVTFGGNRVNSNSNATYRHSSKSTTTGYPCDFIKYQYFRFIWNLYFSILCPLLNGFPSLFPLLSVYCLSMPVCCISVQLVSQSCCGSATGSFHFYVPF